jgi:hypothetical protein
MVRDMPTIREQPLSSPMTWQAETLLENDGLVKLDGDCLAELDGTARELEANPLPTEVSVSPLSIVCPQNGLRRTRQRSSIGC